MLGTKQLFLDVIHDRVKGTMLSRKDERTYMLRYVDEITNAKVDALVSTDVLYSVDTRLPEVLAAMADNNHGRILSIRRVQTTMLVHWARQNHVIDLTPKDDLYNHHVSPQKQRVWYLSAVKNIESLGASDFDIHVRLLCYSVERTASGVEYVFKKSQARLNRNLDWLDQHFRNGRAVLGIIETLDLKSPQLENYLHTQYLAVPLSSTEYSTLPEGLSLS